MSLPGELIAGLWSAVHEPRLWFVVAVSLVGGVVRGYSGFGGALIVVPLAAMAMGPTMAVRAEALAAAVGASKGGAAMKAEAPPPQDGNSARHVTR